MIRMASDVILSAPGHQLDGARIARPGPGICFFVRGVPDWRVRAGPEPLVVFVWDATDLSKLFVWFVPDTSLESPWGLKKPLLLLGFLQFRNRSAAINDRRRGASV